MYRRIRELREARDLTQKEMAKALNCSQQVYSNYELGQRDIPTDVLITPFGNSETSIPPANPSMQIYLGQLNFIFTSWISYYLNF